MSQLRLRRGVRVLHVDPDQLLQLVLRAAQSRQPVRGYSRVRSNHRRAAGGGRSPGAGASRVGATGIFPGRSQPQ
eukprot:8958819-Pyramimonas_sp.AAC.1